jgi:hypothetical protein
LERLKTELDGAVKRYVTEQNALVDEARRLRDDLARRAPEVDNSDMERPEPSNHAYTKWDLDSFARFDDLVERDARLQIGYPTVPRDHDPDPGVVSRLLQILRGRYRAAVYCEDAPGGDPEPIRNDLEDLGNAIGKLGGRHDHALTRYRQDARTLPGLAFARLVYFGSDLNPEPPVLESDEDVERWLDKTLREWAAPRTLVRKLVNHEQMDDWERRAAEETEHFLKGELDRLHQELTRRIAPGRGAAAQVLRDPWVINIGGGIIVGIVFLIVGFYLGR